QGVVGLVFRDKHLVHFLTRANAGEADLAVRGHGPGQIQNAHARNLGHEDLAALHRAQAVDDEVHPLLQSDPEASHSFVGDGNDPGLALFDEQRDHAAAAPDDVAVPGATEAGAAVARVRVPLHEQLFGAQLRRPVQIDGIDGLIGADRQNFRDPRFDRGLDDIGPAQYVGLDGLERVVFAGRDLLHRRRVDDDVDAVHGATEALQVAYVADEVADVWTGEITLHLRLLQLVAAEDDQFARRVALHDRRGEHPAE